MSLREQIQTALGQNYTVERELGGGGMSRVLLARDVTLDRSVVVKVLSEESTTGVSAERFRREIQVIARLQHPHVVPILTAGKSEGGLYYVMPFLSGETLRARLAREGPLPVVMAVRILREVLDALAFAHSHGVIHRDIKPENILLSGGHAVVADFGVAKALHESGTVTSAGIALGTPAYMAPEQAAADPTADHRVDLYATSVVAYEMLTGAPPFTGTPVQVMRAHMVDPAPPILQRRPDIPETLAEVLMRALEKEPRDRPASAAEMVAILDAVTTPSTSAGMAIATPAASPAGRSGPSPIARVNRLVAALAGVALIGAGYAAWRGTRPPVIASAQSIAIVPFSVATGDTALVRLGQNLVTTIGANLDGIGELRVTDGMTMLSNARAKGHLLSAADAMALAQKLGARSVVHGTLVQQGTTVRADAALYESQGNGSPLVRVSVTMPADSIAALTDSLTWQLLRAVWSRGRAPTPTVAAITTRSQPALRDFLEGERLFARGAIAEASDAFKRAAETDTAFLFAHYRYRNARAWMALPVDTTITRRLRRHVMELPERERSLVATIDSTFTQHQRVAAYRRLTQRYPDYPPAWVTLGDYLIHHALRSGFEIRDAIEPWQEAVRLMPYDMESANHLVFACIGAADPCAGPAFQHFDSLVRADSAPSAITRFIHRRFLLTLGEPRRGLVDSVVAASLRDSLTPAIAAPFRIQLAPAALDRPEVLARWDSVNAAVLGKHDQYFGRDGNQLIIMLDRAMRGDVQTLERLDNERTRRFQFGAFGGGAAVLRMRALAEVQGFLTAGPRTSELARTWSAEAAATTATRREAGYIVALNALLRSDTAAFRRELAVLSADTSRMGRIAVRSLRGISLGREGRRAAAAESLLVLEREHGGSVGKVWTAFGANRLLAAQWLTDEKRYAAADSLLRFTEGYVFAETSEAAMGIVAAAYLQRSRIAEGMGEREKAVRYASQFLQLFDLAPPSQRPLIDEARSRVRRLGRPEGGG